MSITKQQVMYKDKKDGSKTTIRIPKELMSELKHLAIDDNKTLGEIITEGLTEYLQERKNRNKI
ncbi:MAG: ribbon-helix-helix domain-containing protein [Nitrososphaeraceae archaeon]|nr:ribbon-helix-helix domain-containing protein [Nitrososphaeraceae archaeon]